jgi:single-strand DNA-binding protein
MSINKVLLAGNLTRDAELRSLPSGSSVLAFGIAVNERRKNNETGQWEDRPNYFDCTMFGARAEAISRYLTKGTKVALEGRLQWRQWEKDGQTRSKVDIIVNEIEFMSSREGGMSHPVNTAQSPAYSQPPAQYGQQPAQYSQAPSQYDMGAAPAPQAPAPAAPSVPNADAYADSDIPF